MKELSIEEKTISEEREMEYSFCILFYQSFNSVHQPYNQQEIAFTAYYIIFS